jgi:uncharacterized protein
MQTAAEPAAVAARDEAYVSSRYNFYVPVDDGALIYNSSSGAVMKLASEAGRNLAQILSTKFVTLFGDEVSAEVWDALRENGFVVPSGFDELRVIKDRFSQARREAPVFLTLTTTQDCNLGCYYCYEERTKSRLGQMDVASILAWIRQTFAGRPDKYLHVDWYGGEPLLNVDFIEAASPAIQQVCAEEKIDYTASIISNGTLWPDDVAGFARRHKIQQAQISFDGLRDNHNQRRRYRAGFKQDGDSAFDHAVRVVDGLLSACRVDVRLNLDRGNYADLAPFVDFAKARGWFDREYPCVVMPARLAYYTARSAFMRKVELNSDDLDDIRVFMKQARTDGRVIVDEEDPDPDIQDFAYPRTSVCAALAHGSQVVGAEGLIYKCGLLVGDRDKAVGRLSEEQPGVEEQFPAAKWWDDYDPTTLPNCSRCSFLPVCWGGCPLKHLHQDSHALEERSRYWRKHLPHFITRRFGETPPAGFVYTEADQFR